MDYGSFADTECSSGCESGWTLYLENTVIQHPLGSCRGTKYIDGEYSHLCESEKSVEQEQEEEDLSMVSDASSGPPHIVDEEEEEEYGHNINGCFYHTPINVTLPKTNTKRQKSKEKQQPSILDDTASSHFFDFSNNNYTITNDTTSVDNIMDFSQGYSTNHFQRSPYAYQEQYDFFQSSLLPPNQLQGNQWFEGERWA